MISSLATGVAHGCATALRVRGLNFEPVGRGNLLDVGREERSLAGDVTGVAWVNASASSLARALAQPARAQQRYGRQILQRLDDTGFELTFKQPCNRGV